MYFILFTFYFILFYLFYCISFYFIVILFYLFHFISVYFILFRFISFYFILFHFSFIFISFYSVFICHFISFHFTSFHLIPSHTILSTQHHVFWPVYKSETQNQNTITIIYNFIPLTFRWPCQVATRHQSKTQHLPHFISLTQSEGKRKKEENSHVWQKHKLKARRVSIL
jgi:hypothetical protein